MMIRKKIECTVVFLDIRDFTNNLSNNIEADDFYNLIENVYSEGLSIAEELSSDDNYYINSTGDGFVCIFFGDYHYLQGYIYSLLISLTLPKHFINYFKYEKKEGDYWFGIGIESGYVKEVYSFNKEKYIKTFIGEVVNIAARLESLTKDHARAPIIYGPELNEKLTGFFRKVSYYDLITRAKREMNSNKAKSLHEQMSLINSKMLSSYLFEHRIKGMEEALPVFRVSPSLQDVNKDHFWELIDKIPISLLKRIKIVFQKSELVWKL